MNSSTSSQVLRKIFKLACNGFGLFQQYYATQFPNHDPTQNISSNNLVNPSPALSTNVYHPYPNQSSFLLSEWYWNGGKKKSQLCFQHLLEIVGHPAFHPEDVAGNNWWLIDAQLSGECCEGPNNRDSWVDGEGDGDWIKTPIKISVPFHKWMSHPGQKEFDAGILYHCKLMSVIREKITRLSTHSHLHFEPYEYFWQPNNATEPVQVYSKLYTSETFIEAHRVLQDVSFHGLYWVLCSCQTALSWPPSVVLNYHLFILWLEMNQKIIVGHLNILLIWRQYIEFLKLYTCEASILLNGSFLMPSRPLQPRTLGRRDLTPHS